jgi:hypothetical protein
MESLKEKPVRKVVADAPTRHTGIDVLREYLFSGTGGDFRRFAAKKRVA